MSNDLWGNIPAPGEPLTYREAPENKQAIEAEIKERLERIAPKLSGWKLWRLKQRHQRLKTFLKNRRWNDLIERRASLYEQYIDLGNKYRSAATPAQKEKLREAGLKISAEGKDVASKLAKLQPFADEFVNLQRRLDGHNDAVRYEKEELENIKAFHKEIDAWKGQIQAACRQNKRLCHRWTDHRGKEQTDIPLFEEIIHRPDRVYFKIRTTFVTNIFGWKKFYRSALPRDVDIDALTSRETLENLSAVCRRTVTAEHSKDGTALFWVVSRLDSADGIPNSVRYSQVAPYYPQENHLYTPWLAGVSTDRRVETYNFETSEHMLIAGSTGSGKSTFVNSLICTLIMMNSPQELRFVFIDNKRGIEFLQYNNVKHKLMDIVTNREDVLPILKKLRVIMENRFVVMSKVKAKKLLDYNRRVAPESSFPRIILAIDEMSTLSGMGKVTSEIQDQIRVISAQGRAVGIHLILSTQNTNVNIVAGDIKTNFTMRVCGKMPDMGSSMTILGSASAVNLPPGIAGRFIFRRGITETIVQTPLISETEILNAVQIANEYPDPTNIAEFEAFTSTGVELQSNDIPAPIEPRARFTQHDLLEIVFKDFGGHLTAKSIHKNLGNEIVTLRVLNAMVGDIVNAGGVEYEGVSYTVKKVRKAYHLIQQPIQRENTEQLEENDDNNQPTEPDGVFDDAA